MQAVPLTGELTMMYEVYKFKFSNVLWKARSTLAI